MIKEDRNKLLDHIATVVTPRELTPVMNSIYPFVLQPLRTLHEVGFSVIGAGYVIVAQGQLTDLERPIVGVPTVRPAGAWPNACSVPTVTAMSPSTPLPVNMASIPSATR